MEERIKDPVLKDVSLRLGLYGDAVKKLVALSGEIREKTENDRQEAFDFVYRTLQEDVCRKCPGYRSCFGAQKEETAEEIAFLWNNVFHEGRAEGYMASEAFRKRCVFFQAVTEEFGWLYRLIYQNIYWKKRLSELRYIMRRQMASQGLLLEECRKQLLCSDDIKGKRRRQLRLRLLGRGLFLREARQYRNISGNLEIHLELQVRRAQKISVIEKIISGIYQKEFCVASPERWLKIGRNYLTFVEEGSFFVLFGKKSCGKNGEKICGDTFSFTENDRNRAIMILSDGMGVGESAFEGSRRLLEVFEAMLDAGASEECALELLHNARLLRGEEEFSTLDVSLISLRTGTAKILKAGGTATFIRHGDSVERITAESLPPGCLSGQQFALKYKKLYHGDMVIMVSDGVLDFEAMPEIPFTMEMILEKIETKNAQTFADRLMEAIPVPVDGHDDDRTVLVAAVWEKGHDYVGKD